MRTCMVIVWAPCRDNHSFFRAVAEELARQALVPELAFEAFIDSAP